MARTSNLIQRKGRWYFNRAFPKELWPIVGKAPFRLSLSTDSLEEAQCQRGTAEQRYWAAVDQARQTLGESRPRALSDNKAVGMVSRWFAQRNRELESDHLHHPTPPVACRIGRGHVVEPDRAAIGQDEALPPDERATLAERHDRIVFADQASTLRHH